jgi:hypothetical protein
MGTMDTPSTIGGGTGGPEARESADSATEELVHSVEVVAILHELAAAVLRSVDLAQALEQVVRVACSVLPEPPAGRVTLFQDSRPAATASAGDLPPGLDEQQYSLGEGPWIQAVASREMVVVNDLSGSGLWPGWSAAALAAGIRSVCSLPIAVDPHRLGLLNLYAAQPDAFVETHLRVLMPLAEQSGLLLSGLWWQIGRHAPALDGDSAGVALVERAVGVIMAQQGCPEERAREALVQAAGGDKERLREIAVRLLGKVQHPGR